ncbi:hypothetical protein EVAR_72993_1 [Eumeta japonica]|uniref:Uncharacterized protein n=1 Tax=Eumeta variegata TaxID=151549 RepID=A0A4C1SVA5_EUMVA|nr:hypothetical protein EVAR_72993_1 [Eumeta japonica]
MSISFFELKQYGPPGGRFGISELQHIDVLLSVYRGLGEPRSGNGVLKLLRREGLWLCYRIALRALPEGYNIGTMRVGSSGAVAHQQTVSRFLGAVKLMHDAHLSASSHLFGMPILWKDGASPKLLSKIPFIVNEVKAYTFSSYRHSTFEITFAHDEISSALPDGCFDNILKNSASVKF